MRKMLSIVALAFAVALTFNSMVKAADAAKPLHGKVTAVAKDSANDKIKDITVTGHAKKGETAPETVVKADDSTKVTKGKDNEAATLADVEVGSYVSVTLGDEGKPAVSIQILPPHKKPTDASTKTK